MDARGSVKRYEIEATVIRADGTREELGVVASTSKRWMYGPGRFRSYMRIRRANRRLEKEE